MRALLLAFALAGCAEFSARLGDSLRPFGTTPGPEVAAADDPAVRAAASDPDAADAAVAGAGQAEALPEAPTTAEDFDTTTPEERAVATAGADTPDDAEERLGTTVVSLGDPTDPGLWLDTPLVSAERPGRIVLGEEAVLVTLRPSGAAAGSGSRISLPAMRLLKVSLTDLPTVEVFGR